MIIGLTGNIGSGKTFVANIFKKFGCKIIHLDEIGHQVLQSAECKKELINAFGNEIIDSEGKIDREKLRKVSFETRENLNKLNSIVHPVMLKSLKNKLSRNKNEKVIVLEAALLFELGLDKEMDKIITVYTPRLFAYLRVKKLRNLSFKEFNRIYSSQLPPSYKMKRSHYVIYNILPSKFEQKKIKKWVKEFLKKNSIK